MPELGIAPAPGSAVDAGPVPEGKVATLEGQTFRNISPPVSCSYLQLYQ
jgi:hypothetical protein